MITPRISSSSWIWSRIKRYGTAEVTGTITSAIGVATSTLVFDTPVWIAIIGTLSENIGFYSVIFFTEFRADNLRLAAEGKTPSWSSRLHVLASLYATFGLAESVDSLFSRPALLGLGGITGEIIGRVAGGTGQISMGVGAFLCKFAADIIYYSMVEIPGATLSRISRPKRP